MSDVIAQPTFGGVTLPFPDGAEIAPIWISADNLTLGGKTRRDVMARKYQYVLQWKWMNNTDYDALEAIVNNLVPATFVYAKWPQSVSGISCLGTLSIRKLEYGAGNTHYLSSVTLTLIEVESRI